MVQVEVDDPNAAVQVVLHHLASGNLATAETVMASVSDAALCQIDVPPLCDPFQAAGFGYGLERLASFFRSYQTHNLFLRLRAVQWVIQAGAADAALRELEELRVMDGAAGHALAFLDCYDRLGRLDLVPEVVGIVSPGEAVPLADRVRIGFEIAAFLQARSLRGPLFQQLHRLNALCDGDLDRTIRLADMYIGIGERSFARDAFERLPEALLQAPLSRLYLVQLAREPDRAVVLSGLQRLAAEPTDDWVFWFKLSYAAEANGDPALALEAARKARAHPPQETVWLDIRLAQVLAACGQLRAALDQIASLLPNDQAMAYSGETLGDVALACGDPGLALKVSARWLALSPGDPQALIRQCVYRRRAGDEPGLLELGKAILQRSQAGAKLTTAQFRLLIDALGGVGGELEREVAAEAVRQHPDEVEFAALAKEGSLAEKFRGPESSPAPKPAKPGWLRWFGL